MNDVAAYTEGMDNAYGMPDVMLQNLWGSGDNSGYLQNLKPSSPMGAALHAKHLQNLGPVGLLAVPAIKGAAGATGAHFANKALNRGKMLQNLEENVELQELIGLGGVKKAAIGAAKKKIGFQNLQMLI